MLFVIEKLDLDTLSPWAPMCPIAPRATRRVTSWPQDTRGSPPRCHWLKFTQGRQMGSCVIDRPHPVVSGRCREARRRVSRMHPPLASATSSPRSHISSSAGAVKHLSPPIPAPSPLPESSSLARSRPPYHRGDGAAMIAQARVPSATRRPGRDLPCHGHVSLPTARTASEAVSSWFTSILARR